MGRYQVDRGVQRRTKGNDIPGLRDEAAWGSQGVDRTPLDCAITEKRVPTLQELQEDMKCLIGATQVVLRKADNVYRTATAINQLASSMARLAAIEAMDELSPEMFSRMEEDELRSLLEKHMKQIQERMLSR